MISHTLLSFTLLAVVTPALARIGVVGGFNLPNTVSSLTNVALNPKATASAQAAASSVTSSALSPPPSASASTNSKSCPTTAAQINSLFSAGGPNTTVQLCPGSVLTIIEPITFTAANQELSTKGYPTDGSRALIRVLGPTQTTAIAAYCDACNGARILNIQVDGNRPNLGRIGVLAGALIEAGIATGQTISYVKAYEPRGWSCLHLVRSPLSSSASHTSRRFSDQRIGLTKQNEGAGLTCSGATISNKSV